MKHNTLSKTAHAAYGEARTAFLSGYLSKVSAAEQVSVEISAAAQASVEKRATVVTGIPRKFLY